MRITKKRLGEICRLEYGKNLPNEQRAVGPVKVYGSNGVVGNHSKPYTSGKTIVVGRKGSIGEIHISQQACWPIDTTYYIDQTCTECDLDWLAFALQFLKLGEMNKASGVPGLNRDDAYERTLYVPDLISDQQKLALKLKIHFAEIEKARQAANTCKHDLSKLLIKQRQKALESLNHLPRVPLENYLDGIQSGKSIKTTELPALKDEVGVLKVSAISWNRFQPEEAKSVIGNYQPKEEHRVKKGDLIISRANTVELVGAVVLVKDDYPNRLLSDKTLRLLIKTEKAIPEYLLHVMKLPEARKHIEGNATGSSDSMRNISQTTIASIPIPEADDSTQKEVIELLETTQTEINKIEQALKLLTDDVELLPNRMLEETFRFYDEK